MDIRHRAALHQLTAGLLADVFLENFALGANN